jgi:hypothetical protein
MLMFGRLDHEAVAAKDRVARAYYCDSLPCIGVRDRIRITPEDKIFVMP